MHMLSAWPILDRPRLQHPPGAPSRCRLQKPLARGSMQAGSGTKMGCDIMTLTSRHREERGPRLEGVTAGRQPRVKIMQWQLLELLQGL